MPTFRGQTDNQEACSMKTFSSATNRRELIAYILPTLPALQKWFHGKPCPMKTIYHGIGYRQLSPCGIKEKLIFKLT